MLNIVAFSFVVESQSYWDLSHNRIVYSTNLDAYVGEWEYKGENEVFRIILKRGLLRTSLQTGDCLIGDYYYQSNGVVLDMYSPSKIPAERNDSNKLNLVIYANNANIVKENSNPNVLYMLIRDKRFAKRSFNCKIILLSPTQIHWILENDEGPVDMDYNLEFSIPTDLVLTKVK